MADLNNLSDIKKLDPKDVFGSSKLLDKQCEQIWNDVKNLNLPVANIKNIVICGMGGSSYGGHVTLSMFKDKLNVPLVVQNGYDLPAFADSSTLVVLTSYSGNTEETLSCANEAKNKGSKTIVLTSGGKLADFIKDNTMQGIVFEPVNNPSGQPRLGTGYIVLGTIAILNKLGIIEIKESEVTDAIDHLRNAQENIMREAKKLAQEIEGRIPLIFASLFLEGNAHIIRNQLNETAKSFSAFEDIPELNHHLMEGLKNPKGRKLVCLFLDSEFYPQIIKKRITLTKDVVNKNGVKPLEYKAKGETKLSQMLEILSLGGFLSFYLAVLYDQDPSVIPWVDYFKEQLHPVK